MSGLPDRKSSQEPLGRQRRREQKALAEGGLHPAQLLGLVGLLDALGHDLELEALAQVDDPPHELLLLASRSTPSMKERSILSMSTG